MIELSQLDTFKVALEVYQYSIEDELEEVFEQILGDVEENEVTHAEVIEHVQLHMDPQVTTIEEALEHLNELTEFTDFAEAQDLQNCMIALELIVRKHGIITNEINIKVQ